MTGPVVASYHLLQPRIVGAAAGLLEHVVRTVQRRFEEIHGGDRARRVCGLRPAQQQIDGPGNDQYGNVFHALGGA